MASLGALPCCRMACICSVMGISTFTRMGQADGGAGGHDAFGDHAVHAADDLIEFASMAEFHAYAAVAGEPAGAGEHQVSQAGEAAMVSARPPQATARRVISCRPRVMSPATVLWP